jgi:MoaA/NifB/PqqE/SkfB family radical SAM enzyme
MIKPIPTKRFMIDISHECNIKCKFCYHLHTYDKWKESRKSFDLVKALIDQGKARGNNYLDITGGEPTIYPDIEKVIEYALSQGIRTCIITNGIVSEKKTQSIIDSGIDDWLISRHGLEKTHNFLTNTKNGYNKQIRFIEQLVKNHQTFRFNIVISKYNQNELYDIVHELLWMGIRIVNFINFNPHTDWMSKDIEVKEVMANLRIVENNLNLVIKFLEDQRIGVNVRYYPMCRILAKYRRCICNDLHVSFDPYEWDYPKNPKTFEHYYKYSVNELSNKIEEKEKPCWECDLQWICGGINKTFHKYSNEIYGEVCIPQTFEGDKKDFYFYRQNNVMTLKER